MPPIINPRRGHILGCKWGWGHTGRCCTDVFIHKGGGKAPSEGPRGSEGCGLSALALLRQWGKHGLGPPPSNFRRTFPKQPSLEMLWPGHLRLGLQAGIPLVPQTNTAAAQLPGSWSPVWGSGGIAWGPPKLCLPLPRSPRPGLRLLKRLQPLRDLILLLFSSAPPWGPARPPKKPCPAPGDRDPRGVGGEGFCPPGRRGAGAAGVSPASPPASRLPEIKAPSVWLPRRLPAAAGAAFPGLKCSVMKS